MSDEVKATCLNCRWAEWPMTRHDPPRIDTNKIGRCVYSIKHINIPASVPSTYVDRLKGVHGWTIFPKRPYEDCPTWEDVGISWKEMRSQMIDDTLNDEGA